MRILFRKTTKLDADLSLKRLVITIIVMLILAGVSLNAIIGDNGIINSAQSTKVKSGIVALEEYLREKYIEEYGNGDDLTYALDYLISSYPEMFYIPKDEGFGSLDYIESEGKSLYLIRKSGLPESIQEQLVGGDAGEGTYSDYASLNDVYGVTQKLKVYYCNNGISSISGLTIEDIDNAIDREVFSTTISGGSGNTLGELLSNYDTSEDGIISSSEVRDIKEIEITSAVNLKDIYNLYALEKLVVKDVNNINLSGIENLTKLNFIYFYNSKAVSYEPIGKMGGKIKRIYFHHFRDEELSKLVEDIKDYDLSNLEYLGFWNTGSYNMGIVTSINDWGKTTWMNYSQSSTGILDFSKLSELSESTKKAVKYFYASANKLTNLDGITSLSNLEILRVSKNNITTLKGIDNLTNLRYLQVSYNKLTDVATRPESEMYNDSLYGLENCKNLELLNICYNNNIRFISHIKDLHLKTLYMEGLYNISDEELSTTKRAINLPETTVFNNEYTFKLIDNELTTSLNISNQTINLTNFKKIGSANNLNSLYMQNTKIVKESGEILGNDENTVENLMIKIFNNLKNVEYLDIKGMTIDLGDGTGAHKIKKLNFINTSLYSKLVWLCIENTDVIAMGDNNSLSVDDKAISISNTNLLNSITSLRTFIVNTNKFDFYYLQDMINRLDYTSRISSYYNMGGLCCANNTSLKTLEKCDRITNFESNSYYHLYNDGSTLNLSNCDSLEVFKVHGWSGTVVFPSSIKQISTVVTNMHFKFENDGTDIILDRILIDECYDDVWNSRVKEIADSGVFVNDLVLSAIWNKHQDTITLQSFFDNDGNCNWLKRLEFIFPTWDSISLSAWFSKCIGELIGTSITELGITCIPEYNLDFLDGFENQLTYLSIGSSKIQNINKIKKFKNLTSLSLYGNYITNISAIGELTDLEELDINTNSIGGGLSILENLHKLENLNLSGNNLYTEENVYMGNGEVREKCINIFKKLHTMHKLISLDLSNTNLRGIENKLKVAPEWIELKCDPKLETNK